MTEETTGETEPMTEPGEWIVDVNDVDDELTLGGEGEEPWVPPEIDPPPYPVVRGDGRLRRRFTTTRRRLA